MGATRVIEGGQSMNPSAAEIIAAIDAVPSPEVIVLPNNSNVILTAEQAALHALKAVRVVPSRSVQAGLAAMGRYVSTNTPEQNEQDMLDGLASISTGEITIASRDVELDGVQIRKGDFLGLVDETAVSAAPDMSTVVEQVVARVLEGEREWLAILTGEGAPSLDGLVAAIEREHPGISIEIHHGGQPHYPLLFVAE
jgi:hypothetical protein